MASLDGDNNAPRPGAWLSDIAYSHESTVAAFKSYYEFLANMYMDPDMIKTPPATGWAHITPESMQALGKSEKVITLQRHLPYVSWAQGEPEIHSAAACTFVDWERIARNIAGRAHGDLVLYTMEPAHTPPHVVGISEGPYKMLLDTKLGMVHFTGGPTLFHDDPGQPIQPIQDDPYDYAPEEEDWRLNSAWPIADFFEVLKRQFINLDYVPLSNRIVEEVYLGDEEEGDVLGHEGACRVGACRIGQEIFWRHGWSLFDQFRKEDCVAELEGTIAERFPGHFWPEWMETQRDLDV
ncbi:hypothetical protein CBER1_04335 [Cercospora berteroae]|uniref:Uncharacterized protein n=1 Tax=Cercospora berteroae TaxID=357750 RepID=A0A2S6CJ68_9PEZI|nr:hypothetical protein CBER1_04335 [Cercospora berteroae]